MPFLGVYDNVRYSPNCTPTTYQHWGWGFVSEHFVPQVFSRLPKSEGWQIRTPSLSCIYILTAVSLWSVSAKECVTDMEKDSVEKLLEIQKLKEAGVLNEAEFEEQKKRILEEDKNAPQIPVTKTRNLYSDILNLWSKLHSLFRLDQKKQEELSTNKLALFVLLINIVSFVGLMVMVDYSGVLSTMMTLPLLLEASLLLWGIWKSNNKILIGIMAILMLLPIVGLFHITDFYLTEIKKPPFDGLEALMNKAYCASLLYAFVSFLLMASEGKAIHKITKVLALATILNPVFYGLALTGGLTEATYHWGYDISDSSYYAFNNVILLYWVIFFVAFWLASHLIYSILTGQSLKQSVVSVLKGWTTIFQVAKRYKKICYAVVGAFVVFIIGYNIKHYYDQRQAAIAWEQKQIQDSIANVKRQEQERKNAIIRAERERIAAIQQAKRDSIDKVEHQWFVKKYAKIGIIFTNLEITRGTNNDGIPIKGIKCRFFNPTNKTIKYVIAHCYPINGVGDVMGYPQNYRGIGPIASHDFGEFTFDDVFEDRNDVIDDIGAYFTIVYSNGSSKDVKWKSAYVDDFKTSWFE